MSKLFSWVRSLEEVKQLFTSSRGSNSHGQLGIGRKSEEESVPIPLVFEFPINYITGSGQCSVFCTAAIEGKLLGAGANDKHQVSTSLPAFLLHFTPVPTPFSSLQIRKVACGWDHSFALTEDGDVFVWGSNAFGQLGIDLHVKQVPFPIQLLEVFSVVDVCCGLRHSAIATPTGVFTCGYNRKGQLGHKDQDLLKICNFIKVLTVTGDVPRVSCGENFTLASVDNLMHGWGDNRYGQIGADSKIYNNYSTPTSIAIQLTSGDNIKQIYCGWTHSSVLTNFGKVITWGRNNYGQLGETRSETWKPKAITTDLKFSQLAVGSHHTVGLTTDSQVFSWGWNEHGSCGDGSRQDRFQLGKVLLPNNFEPVLIGSGAAHSFVAGEFK